MNNLSILDYIKLIVTTISFFDFVIFTIFYLNFLFYVTYKSNKKSTKIISISVGIFILIFKLGYIPIFISSSVIIDYQINGSDIIIYILTIINISLSVLPLFLSIKTICKKKNNNIKDYSNKYVNIIMPIYNEDPQALLDAIKSVKCLDYPKHLLHLYLAFDEGVIQTNSDGYNKLIEYYNLYLHDERYRINMYDENLLISICRFDHGGKKSAQYGAFKEIESDNKNISESLLFFIDSDIVLKEDSLAQFTYKMETSKKSGLTGMITCITSNFLSIYQNIEYISGQILSRNLEGYLGAVTCLPGAFTILKYSFFKKVSNEYFKSTNYENDKDYHRLYLGEDRYLTHLLMEIEPKQLDFCELASCKTHPPNSMLGLLKQRKRWYLGHISNDTWMVSCYKLWCMYPVLCIFNLINSIRGSSIYIYLLYFVLLLNKDVNIYLWLSLVILPTLLNFILIIIYSIKIKTKITSLFYIALCLFHPILNMIFMYYTIFTIKKNGWGGIREEQAKISIQTNDSDKIIEIIIQK